MKKVIKIVLWSLLGLLVVILVFAGIKFGPFIKGATSVQKLDDGLYYWNTRATTALPGSSSRVAAAARRR